MIKFDFSQFLFDHKLSLTDLANKLDKKLGTISTMNKRGTVKPSFFVTLENEFGDCSKYIAAPKKRK